MSNNSGNCKHDWEVKGSGPRIYKICKLCGNFGESITETPSGTFQRSGNDIYITTGSGSIARIGGKYYF